MDRSSRTYRGTSWLSGRLWRRLRGGGPTRGHTILASGRYATPLAEILASLEAAAPARPTAWWKRFCWWRRPRRATGGPRIRRSGRTPRRFSTTRLSAGESLEVRLALASDLDPFSPVIDVTASTIDAMIFHALQVGGDMMKKQDF